MHEKWKEVNRREILSSIVGIPLTQSTLAAVVIDAPAGVRDHTDIFAKAIEKAAAEKKGVVLVPPGHFYIRQLVLRSGVVVRGAGRRATVLKALPSNESGLVQQGAGPIINAGLRDLTMEGCGNPKQWALHLTAQPADSGKAHGGLWWSSIEEITIQHFDRGICLEGGNTDYMLPHQFNCIRNLTIELPEASEGPCLRLTGQVNQTLLSQVYIDAITPPRSAAVEIIGLEGALTSPKVLQFDVVTIQNAPLGLYIRRAQNVRLSSCWFEALGSAARIEGQSLRVQFDNCRFANSGKDGICLHFGDASSGSIEQSIFAGDNNICHKIESSSVSISGNDYIWGSSSGK